MDKTILRTCPTWSSTDGWMARARNQLDLKWSLKRLYHLMNAKLVDGAKDIVRAEASKGNIRGARVWKRV